MRWLRFSGFLVALAMLLMPLSMIGGAHSMAVDTGELTQPDHCSGAPAEVPEAPGWSAHCLMACSAVAPSMAVITPRIALPAKIEISKIQPSPPGRMAETETPPPRFS